MSSPVARTSEATAFMDLRLFPCALYRQHLLLFLQAVLRHRCPHQDQPLGSPNPTLPWPLQLTRIRPVLDHLTEPRRLLQPLRGQKQTHLP